MEAGAVFTDLGSEGRNRCLFAQCGGLGVYGLVCSGWTRFVAELWMGGEREATIVGTDLENGSFDGCGAGQTLMGGGMGGPMMQMGLAGGVGWWRSCLERLAEL